MTMKSDFEISHACQKEPITAIAQKLGLSEEALILYGRYKAKLETKNLPTSETNAKKLILVTSITPTESGEGKSTVTIGLADALQRIGKKTCVALREPSLGPVLGRKGGAAGGGYAQVVPMEEINLHFTGDMHAITTAHNAVATLVHNHVFQGNALEIERIVFPHVLDMNARQLRHVTVNTGTDLASESQFDITVASELMAILCLAENLTDLKARLRRVIVAYNRRDEPIYLADLKIEGVITALLKDALKPNLVQTLEQTPAIIHGGPFANIAHGCNSIIATKTALQLADYVVTEAGFGADLGAEKFLNIKCRTSGLAPDVAVVVATIRALKIHGGVSPQDLATENVSALAKGIENLAKHLENLQKFNLPVVVALNVFVSDTQAELDYLAKWAAERGIALAKTEVWEKGGLGGVALAEQVVQLAEREMQPLHLLYEDDLPLGDKIRCICREIYGASDVILTAEVQQQLTKITQMGYGHLPICMAKTPLSLSDNSQLKGRPQDFTLTIHSVKLQSGAGFVVAYANQVLTMPGLPVTPSALAIDIDEDNEEITGIF